MALRAPFDPGVDPQPEPDEQKRQADAARQENEIFRHLLSLCCFGLSQALVPLRAPLVPCPSGSEKEAPLDGGEAKSHQRKECPL